MKKLKKTYLIEFRKAIKLKQVDKVRLLLKKFNNSLTDIAINNLAVSLAHDLCDLRGCDYYKPYLNEVYKTMDKTPYI